MYGSRLFLSLFFLAPQPERERAWTRYLFIYIVIKTYEMYSLNIPKAADLEKGCLMRKRPFIIIIMQDSW